MTAENTQTQTEVQAPPEFSLWLSEDKTAVLLTCTLTPANLDTLIAAVCERLETLGIDDLIGHLAAEHHLRGLADERQELSAEPILVAKPPVPPQHERMEWETDFFGGGFYIDPDTGRADYRRPAAHSSVAADEYLGHIVPGEEGAPGMDLFGRKVPAPPLQKVPIKAGAGVVYNSEDRSFYAENHGRIRLTGNTLTVEEVFTVPGSIGLETGNIKHPGSLIVSANIDARSEVQAEGDIEVMGYIEDATVVAGGAVIVHGGIIGAQTHIRSKGNVQARFISNACVESEGDVVAEREIDNATVRALGRVAVPNGRIVGGVCQALGGIIIKDAGTTTGIKTWLIAGEDFLLPQRVKAKLETLKQLEETLAAIHAKVDPYANNTGRLCAKTRETLTVLLQKIEGAEKRRDALKQEIEALEAESKQSAHNEVRIEHQLNSDTYIRASGLTMQNKERVRGPVRAVVHEGDLQLH
ncbi:MAG: FapA family protein [Candidatus Hydrogenedentota bacterium]